MRSAKPVSTPFRLGMTLPTARAAPVLDGITFIPTAPRPPRQSFEEVPSTTEGVTPTMNALLIDETKLQEECVFLSLYSIKSNGMFRH